MGNASKIATCIIFCAIVAIAGALCYRAGRGYYTDISERAERALLDAEQVRSDYRELDARYRDLENTIDAIRRERDALRKSYDDLASGIKRIENSAGQLGEVNRDFRAILDGIRRRAESGDAQGAD